MNKIRARVDSIATTGKAVVTKNGSVVLRGEGQKSVLLQRPGGQKTKAGEYFTSALGGEMPGQGGFNPTQAPQRVGNIEYITTRDSRRRRTRRWDPGESDWVFTALGRSFYSTTKRNYVVQVPVIIKRQRNKDKSAFEMESWLPIAKLGLGYQQLPLNLNHRERLAKVKKMVMDQLDGDVLLTHSDEVWTLDRSTNPGEFTRRQCRQTHRLESPRSMWS